MLDLALNNMLFRTLFISCLILLNVFIAVSQTKDIQAEPYSLISPGFSLSFTDCVETSDNDLILVGRFEKGEEQVFDSVYVEGKQSLPYSINIDKQQYHDSCPVKVLIHKVNSKGQPLWTRLYDFGFSGIKVEIDKQGFIYVLANSGEDRKLTFKSDQAICPSVTKLDTSGAIIWTKKLTSDRYSRGIDIAITDNNSIGVLATTFHLKIDTNQMKNNPDLGIIPVPNSRFVLLDTVGNILSDRSIEMKERLVFNYPEELTQFNNEFFASISTAGHMSTYSNLVKISTTGEIGAFIPSGFIAGSQFSGSKMSMSGDGQIFVTGHMNKDASDFELNVYDLNLKVLFKKSTIIKSPDSSYPVPTSDGYFVIGYKEGTNQIVKYSKSMKVLWSRTYFKSVEKHWMDESEYNDGIVIRGVATAKNGGCYIIGSYETDDYETHAVVYAIDKDGNLIF